MNMPITSAACTFTFIPVTVARGRKFRGFGYLLEGGYTYTRGYPGSGVDPLQHVDYAKIWDPATKRISYVNADYPVDTEIDAAKIQADKDDYVRTTIQSTIDWCKSKQPDEAEALRFARNVLRKNHPELMPAIDVATPDTRDAATEVEKTINWAMGLKTRACYMYDRHCPGGKDLPVSKKLAIAYRSLCKKGITKLDSFKEAWDFYCVLRGVEAEGEKIIG